MTILQEQAALTCRAIVSSDFQAAHVTACLKGAAQKGRRAVWTSKARLHGEGDGHPESHGGTV